MQKETAITINATSTVVVGSDLLVDAISFYADFHRQQMNHNLHPIDKSNKLLARIRRENYEKHKKNVDNAENIIHCIKSANRYGGFKIKIDDAVLLHTIDEIPE